MGRMILAFCVVCAIIASIPFLTSDVPTEKFFKTTAKILLTVFAATLTVAALVQLY